MSKLKKILTTPIKSIYLSSAILVILVVVYVNADNKYIPQIVLKQSQESRILPPPMTQPTVSLSTTTLNNTIETAATTSADNNIANNVSFRDELPLKEGLIIGIANASGNLSIEARGGLDRCYQLDGYERCLTVMKKQADINRTSFYSGTFEKQPNDINPIAKIEASEGCIDFKSIKDAIEWIDSNANKSFNFIYTDTGLTAGWYKLILPQNTGSIVRAQVWQLYINGEKPTMLPGSQYNKFRFAKKAVKVSGVAPPMLSDSQNDAIKAPRKGKKLLKKLTLNAQSLEYCHEVPSDEFGAHVEVNQDKMGIAVTFMNKKNDQIADTLGMSYLRGTLEHLAEEKERINKSNKRPIQDPTKIYEDYTGEAYYVPNDISDWINSKKNVQISAKWFQFKGVDYLYLSAGLDGEAFIVNDSEGDDVMHKTEAIYMFVGNKHSVVTLGQSIDILKIENDSLIIGVANRGYEGSNGEIIAFDGNKSSVICKWGSGL